jgi:hypothetical protein
VTSLPDKDDVTFNPSIPMVPAGFRDVVSYEVLVLEGLPLFRPSSIDQLLPSNLALTHDQILVLLGVSGANRHRTV